MAYQELIDAIYRSKRRQQAFEENVKNMSVKREQEIAKRKEEIEQKYSKLMQVELDTMLEGVNELFDNRTKFANADIAMEMTVRERLEKIQKALRITDVSAYAEGFVSFLSARTNKNWIAVNLILKNTEKHAGIRKIRNGRVNGGVYEINFLAPDTEVDKIVDTLTKTYKNSDIGLVVNGVSDDVMRLNHKYSELSDQGNFFVVSTKNRHSYNALSEEFKNINEVFVYNIDNLHNGRHNNANVLNKYKYRTCLDDSPIHTLGVEMSQYVYAYKNKLHNDNYNKLPEDDKQFIKDVIEIQNNKILDPTK